MDGNLSDATVSKNNGKIRPVHKGPTLNDILPRPVGVKYLKFIDASLGYHSVKLDEQSSYLMTFSCPFGRHRYIRILF